jgi:endonuclease YncB( thermonuclease family)
MRRLLVAFAWLAASAAQGRTFTGTVTYVTDGDTLWVRPARGKDKVEIRLLDLDAPERCQAFGPEAKQAVRARLLHQSVRVRTRGSDDYGRQLGHLEYRGDDVGAWLVRNGYAWSSSFHRRAGRYAALQAQARSERAGLWARADALEPRIFRQRFGRCP